MTTTTSIVPQLIKCFLIIVSFDPQAKHCHRGKIAQGTSVPFRNICSGKEEVLTWF